MGKNNYIARLEADRKGFFRAGEQTGRQVVLDMMVLALRDPEIMGKDTFGKDRLLKVVKDFHMMNLDRIKIGISQKKDRHIQ